jgi:type IV pilus assembly protein PilW
MNPKNPRAIFAKSKKTLDPAATESGGFTLIELLVAMAIASIMIAAMVTLFTTLTRSYTRQNVAADVQQVARAGVDFMAQSIRMAGLDPDQTGDFGFTVATETSISFAADFDLDGNLDGTETITYSLSGDEL